MSSKPKPIVNFNNRTSIRSVVPFNAKAMPEYVWRDFHAVYVADREAALADNPERLASITGIKNFDAWQEGIRNPNSRVGKKGGLRDGNLFGKSIIAISFNKELKVVGGVIVANNTNGHAELHDRKVPKPLWKSEAGLKMIVPPGPWANIRDFYLDPNAQEALDVSDDTAVVSGIILRGLSMALEQFKPEQRLSGWRIQGDPVDKNYFNVTEYLEMTPGETSPNSQDGYISGAVKEQVTSTVARALRIIDGGPEDLDLSSDLLDR